MLRTALASLDVFKQEFFRYENVYLCPTLMISTKSNNNFNCKKYLYTYAPSIPKHSRHLALHSSVHVPRWSWGLHLTTVSHPKFPPTASTPSRLPLACVYLVCCVVAGCVCVEKGLARGRLALLHLLVMPSPRVPYLI
jgi:hypothetical protein